MEEIQMLYILEQFNKKLKKIPISKTLEGLKLSEKKLIKLRKEFLSTRGLMESFLSAPPNNELKIFGEKVLTDINEKIFKCIDKILEFTNIKYSTKLSIKELTKYGISYLETGIVRFLDSKEFMSLIFDNEISKILPFEPKDEFPRARKIKRHFVIHVGSTNTGKTYNALQELKKAKKGAYLAPLRLLALEVYEKLNEEGIPCNLLTGEEDIKKDNAFHTSSTVEKFNLSRQYNTVVIDECQMLNDNQRGSAWTKAILGAQADTIHLCCSANAESIIVKLIGYCGDTYEIKKYERDTPLVIQNQPFCFPNSIVDGDALIVFSRAKVLKIGAILKNKGINASFIYGDLPPEVRRKQIEMFYNRETTVIVSTDAIGMGINLPIKRVVFLEKEKFDGTKMRNLLESEIKQISGRAGRKGLYDTGYVCAYGKVKAIRKGIEDPARPIKNLYISPQESTILSLPFGTLYERLKAWKECKNQNDLFRKVDISDMLALAKKIEFMYSIELTTEQKYKCITIPFNIDNANLISLWEKYVKQIAHREMPFTRPASLKDESLESYETYYKQLQLYYNFCVNFTNKRTVGWIYNERIKTAESINKHLLENIKKYVSKCNCCGKILSWDHPFKMCQSCYENTYRSYYYDYY